MKQKERFFIVSFLLMLALTVWFMPQMSMTAYGAVIRVGTIDVQSDWEDDETELKPEDYPGFFGYTSISPTEWSPENNENCYLIYKIYTKGNATRCYGIRYENEIFHNVDIKSTKDALYSKYSQGYKIYYTKGYTVSLTGGKNASASGGGTSQTVIGEITKVTYTAANGYHFDQFTDITKDGITAEWISDTTVEVTGTPTDDVNITIPDATQYKLKVVLSQGGSVTSESAQYPSGVKVELTVTPGTGYQLKAGSPTYTEDGSTVRNPVNGPDSEGKYTFTMPAKNVTVYAEFEAIDYNITLPGPYPSSGEQCKVTVQVNGSAVSSPVTAHYNDSVRLIINLAEGYQLMDNTLSVYPENISVEVNINENNTFTMPADNVFVNAMFLKPPAAKTLTYNTAAQDLVEPGACSASDLYYYAEARDSVPDGYDPYTEHGNKFTTDIPKGTNPGSYFVWYSPFGLEYKNDPVQVTIAKATFNVRVIPGANMTKTSDSGEAEQTVQDKDKIKSVVYTAADGYYFPENYYVEAVNGIIVMRNSDKKITVSGIPSADTEIKLKDPEKETPAARWKINVDIHNYTNTGAKGIPGDVPGMVFSLNISIIDKGNRTEVSKADNVKVNIIGGANTAKISLKDVEFDRKVEDLSEAKYQIVISGIPSEVVSPAPLPQVYKLSYKAWPGGKELVTIYLKWDDGKTSEEPEKIKIYALPEDEIGAYTIDENGVKVYLLFHTKKICEQWLGPGAHCENYERCFHKESPYENPFVTTTGVIGEIVVVGN